MTSDAPSSSPQAAHRSSGRNSAPHEWRPATYVDTLQAVGLTVDHIETHDQAVRDMIDEIRGRLLGAEVMAKLQHVELPGMHFQVAKRLARSAAEAVQAGTVGYTLVIATSPA